MKSVFLITALHKAEEFALVCDKKQLRFTGRKCGLISEAFQVIRKEKIETR